MSILMTDKHIEMILTMEVMKIDGDEGHIKYELKKLQISRV
jgi:hypothetical protein